VKVEYRDPEPNGLATLVGGIIQSNLDRDPERARLLRRATIWVTSTDAGVSMSLRLTRTGVQVANGRVGRPDLRIVGSSQTLVELSSVPLRLGLPDLLTREGRVVARKLLSGEIRAAGLFIHPRKLARLNLLLSVR
jgi:hypothetical protein